MSNIFDNFLFESNGAMTLKDAVRRAAEETGVAKNALYNEVINKKER